MLQRFSWVLHLALDKIISISALQVIVRFSKTFRNGIGRAVRAAGVKNPAII
jgi:hypothetical protein